MSDLQPHWQNDRVTLYCGDALETLKQLPAESVHCCVTSPPYYGLRDYGVEGQIGLEQTPDEYIAKMVEVFREVRRVLRSDGTCWINIGDSYFSQTKGSGGSNPETSPKNAIKGVDNFQRFDPVRIESGSTGCKPKDLIGIPWMLAFALRADGWYLRQDIIWNKPNPMPESVRDRCTKSHEYIFLLSKSSRYYFDNKAIAEKSLHPNAIAAWTCDSRASRGHMLRGNPVGNEASGAEYLGSETRNRRSVWQVTTKPYKGAHFAVFPPDLIEPCILAGCPTDGAVIDPFAGSGTTGMVASMHNRNSVLIELNPQYCELIKERVTAGWQKTKPKSAKKKPIQYESQSSLFDVFTS
jgi:DNA modification methylase